jgi:hypothetical protein
LQALIEFDEAMDRRLQELEKRFAGPPRQLPLDARQTWTPRPNKPR